MKNIFFVVILFLAAIASADDLPKGALDCPNRVIDFKRFPGVTKESEVSRNQDTSGWCVGFSVADLMCYHYNRKSKWTLKDQCSVLDLASQIGLVDDAQMKSGDTLGEMPKKGLSESRILDRTFTEGLCPESILPSEFTNNPKSGPWKFTAALDKARRQQTTEAGIIELGQCKECEILKKEKSLEEISAALKAPATDNEALKNLSNLLCNGKRIGKNVEVKMQIYIPDKKETESVKADKRLAKIYELIRAETPVSVAFAASDFLKGVPMNSRNRDHRFTIIGAKTMDYDDGFGMVKQCVLVVKNSWGPGCDSIDPKKLTPCDDKTGLLYIDEQHVRSTALDVMWIDK